MSFAELNVQITGIPKLRSKLSQLDEAMKEQVRYGLVFEGEKVANTARSLCPVRTGYLRSTIYAWIQDWTLKVGASAHYATYVEFGTRFMKARRFLNRALEFRLQGLVDAVNRGVGDAIREASS
jgi:HK97 gp10 family phage protein